MVPQSAAHRQLQPRSRDGGFIDGVEMRIIGNVLPFIGRAIAPCDGDGTPAMAPDEIDAARHETKVVMIAWFGRVVAWPFGEVTPRMIDPENPKQYAPGNL